MDRKRAEHRRAKAISELAERQHGVIATPQLYSLGLSETQVRHRARNGWLHRIHRGVYAEATGGSHNRASGWLPCLPAGKMACSVTRRQESSGKSGNQERADMSGGW
jgi:hypothetical protein